jgi:hypothetical protein
MMPPVCYAIERAMRISLTLALRAVISVLPPRNSAKGR